MRKLRKLKIENKMLPKDWKKDVEQYIRLKQRIVDRLYEEYLRNDDLLREAIEIKRFLYGGKKIEIRY